MDSECASEIFSLEDCGICSEAGSCTDSGVDPSMDEAEAPDSPPPCN